MEQPYLYDKLNSYTKSDAYPFHVPGHKRQLFHTLLKEFPNPYSIDITEIEGFDNLHHPEGILKDSMAWAASVYGASQTYYLINGSSCGILSAVCGLTHDSDTILMSRGSHKCAYHGVFLNHLKSIYIYPQIIDNFGIQGGLSVDDIKKLLKEYTNIAMVFVVSPTYDGIVSDIKTISEICHNHGIPLVVDEAHGAHFRYGEKFPVSALELGADVVVQSLHKTLPAFTQTALLHVKSRLVDLERLEHYLQIFQSSSPSYLLMTGIESCIRFMETDGRNEMKIFYKHLQELRHKLSNLKRLKLFGPPFSENFAVYDTDPSKIIISSKNTGINGKRLSDLLRERFHLEMEMYGADYVTAITTVMDTANGLGRLKEALFSIDETLYQTKPEYLIQENQNLFCQIRAKTALSIFQAWTRKKSEVKIEDSIGKISGEYIYLYPPGIPIIVPGEILNAEIIETIDTYKKMKLPIQGLRDHKLEKIQIVN